MILRQAKDSDFDAIYEIYMDESVNPFMLYDPTNKNGFRPIFDSLMARDYFWVTEDNGRVTGICTAIIGKGRCTHVAGIYSFGIRKESQNKGIGRKILNEVFSLLAAKGITRFELGVESDNARAFAFYKTLGFVEEGRLAKYMKRRNQDHFIDEILMARLI